MRLVRRCDELITQRETRGREFIGQIFEKSGEIRVRDSCARKRVEYRCSGYGCAWIIHQMMGVVTPLSRILSKDDNLILGYPFESKPFGGRILTRNPKQLHHSQLEKRKRP